VRVSANLPAFHSMPPGSAMASLSPALRRLISAKSGVRRRTQVAEEEIAVLLKP